jgi:hypothetical protein
MTITAEGTGSPKTVGGDNFIVALDLLSNPTHVISPTIIDRENGTYFITESLTVAGLYQGTATLGGFNISGSPFSFQVLPGALSPSDCTITGSGLTVAIAGQTATFTVVARDVYGNVRNSGDIFTATITGPKNLILSDTDNNDGTYTFTYSLPVAGTYSMTVTTSGVLVARY